MHIQICNDLYVSAGKWEVNLCDLPARPIYEPIPQISSANLSTDPSDL